MPTHPPRDVLAGDATAVPAPVRARAAALPPDERRRAIAAATIPLLIEHGAGVTTRQIAEAAGIAEGTIFRVFPDKEAVIEAALEAAFDPAPITAALLGIDADLPLEAILVAAVEIVQRRVTGIWQLLAAIEPTRYRGHFASLRRPPDDSVLVGLLEAHRHELRREPRVAAQLLRGLTLAGSHPAMTTDEPLTPTEIVSVLLDGIRSRPEPPRDAPC
jgi:AcrR family transcriptional regulator